jgi:GNAT superfamily N-acetyltransferase
MHFDWDWRERVRLRDSQFVELRLVRPDDRATIGRGFDHLSPESRYRRFFSPKDKLSEAELDYLTRVDQVDHVAIGAVRQGQDGEEGLGIARFVRSRAEPNVAEAAIAVVDELHGLGLGTVLFQRLIAAARERGIDHFSASVQAGNERVRQLVRDLGITSSVTAGVIDGVAALPDVAPDQPAAEPPRTSATYRALRHAARGELAIIPSSG